MSQNKGIDKSYVSCIAQVQIIHYVGGTSTNQDQSSTHG